MQSVFFQLIILGVIYIFFWYSIIMEITMHLFTRLWTRCLTNMLENHMWKPLEAAQLYLSSFFHTSLCYNQEVYVSLFDITHSSKKKAEIRFACCPTSPFNQISWETRKLVKLDTDIWVLVNRSGARARIVSLARICVDPCLCFPFICHCFPRNWIKSGQERSHLDWSALHLFGLSEMGMEWKASLTR